MSEPQVGIEALRLRLDREQGARLARLIRAQHGFVWRLLRGIGMSDSEADGALGQVFSAAALRIAEIRQGSERAFLFGTALRVASRTQRARVEQAALADSAPALEDLEPRQQAREILAVVLAQMPLELRVVFVLHEIERLSAAEISMIVGIPLSAVASRLSSAHEDFASHLQADAELADSLITAAHEEEPPTKILQHALSTVALDAGTVDGGHSEADLRQATGASSERAPVRGSAAAYLLSAKWLGIGLLAGLALTTAAYGAVHLLTADTPRGAASR